MPTQHKPQQALRTTEGKENEEQKTFVVQNGVLTANGDLYWELLEEFEHACNQLLKSKRQQLTLDLTPVNFISSSFLGCLSNLVLKASRGKKRITLKVTRDISWLFEIMGGRKNMAMEIV